MFSILNGTLSWAITSFGNKLSEKEVKVDKAFKQYVLRQIYVTRDRFITMQNFMEIQQRDLEFLSSGKSTTMSDKGIESPMLDMVKTKKLQIS